jgi:hypothetical protein
MRAWSLERKRFVGALVIFVVWVGMLAALAVVSAYRPAIRSAMPAGAEKSENP